MGVDAERDLYAPVKAFLEAQGYSVKAEVKSCDVVATRPGEPPVIVELKRRFNLDLLLQGVDRLAMTDHVYLAVDGSSARGHWHKRPDGRAARKLCRLIGLGLLLVFADRPQRARVEVVLDPVPYRPRANKRRLGRLLGEHARRSGDPNVGGVTRVKIVTAYRQEALRCCQLLQRDGNMSPRALRDSGHAPNAAKILRHDYYGWFERIERGLYGLSENGRKALETYAHALEPALSGNAVPPRHPAATRRKRNACPTQTA